MSAAKGGTGTRNSYNTLQPRDFHVCASYHSIDLYHAITLSIHLGVVGHYKTTSALGSVRA